MTTSQKIGTATLGTDIADDDRFAMWDAGTGSWRPVKIALISGTIPSVSVNDLQSGGAIGTAADTVDKAPVIVVNQTTSAKLITLPTPTDTTRAKKITLVAGSTARLWTAYKRVILPGMSASFTYVPSVGWKADDVGVQVMFQSGAAQAYPADTNSNDITLGTIPGGFLGANDAVEYRVIVDNTSGTSNKTLRYKFGGQDALSIGPHMASATSSMSIFKSVRNANSTSSQVIMATGLVGDSSINTPSAPAAALSVNTANDVACAVTITKATGSDVTTLRAYEIIYHPAP